MFKKRTATERIMTAIKRAGVIAIITKTGKKVVGTLTSYIGEKKKKRKK